MSENVFYVESFQGDISELNSLFGTAYPEDSPLVDSDFLRWQYENNPAGKAVIACGRSTEDQSLVGVYVVAPVDLWLNGVQVKGALSLNTFTREDFRGKGMFTTLAKSCYSLAGQSGINVIIGFPNPMSYGGFIKKLGFADLGNVTYLIRPLSLINLAKRYLGVTQKPPGRWWEKMLQQSIELINWKQPAEIDLFYQNHRATSSLQKYRSSAYDKWRYSDHPIHTYKAFAIRNKSGEYGATLVIAQPASSEARELRIVDFCVIDIVAGKQLLSYLRKAAKKQFSFLLTYAQPETKEFELLKQAGFINRSRLKKNSEGIPFIMKSLADESPNVDFKRWHICMSDTDVV